MSRKFDILVVSTALLGRLEKGEGLDAAEYAPSEALVDRFSQVNGRATSFTTSPEVIVDLAMDVEEELASAGIAKSDRVGVVVRHRGAGPAAASYRNKVKVTEVVMTRRSSGWVLTSICEDHVFPKTKEMREITLSSTQAGIVARVALKPFKVAKPAVEQVAA